MRTAGIVLLVLQAIAVVSGLALHESPIIDLFTSNEPGIALIAKLIGYFVPAIVGIILLRKAKKKESANSAATAAAPTPTPAPRASAAGGFCPKCGTKTDPDDVFCVNCGAKLR